ncbi:MAG: 50S ribosomal protein L17 [Patescibacteria group bacterium]|nr:50S ribosomal protein L17 [Patescibacteria group bacterium]
MRHHDQNRKFGRKAGQRTALMRSLAEALITHGRIQTTEAKAKSLRPFVERLVTKAKPGTLSARRLVISELGTPARAKKLVDEIAPKYVERAGGYTRIVKLPPRKSDSSKMAVIEFV